MDVWGTEKLWVTIDRANLNFPIRPGYGYKGFIHWDYDPDTNPQNVHELAAQTGQVAGRDVGIVEIDYNVFTICNRQQRIQETDLVAGDRDTAGQFNRSAIRPVCTASSESRKPIW